MPQSTAREDTARAAGGGGEGGRGRAECAEAGGLQSQGKKKSRNIFLGWVLKKKILSSTLLNVGGGGKVCRSLSRTGTRGCKVKVRKNVEK